MSLSFKHRELLIVNGYVLLVLVLGALLAPALFFAAQHFITASPQGWLAGVLGEKEFPSYFNRAVLLAALVGMPSLLKTLHMPWKEIVGQIPLGRGARQFTGTFVLALLSVGVLAWVCLSFGVSRLKPEPPYTDFVGDLISGLTVGVLEEFMFRGAILGVLCHSLGVRAGLFWTTLFFSILHFLKPPLDGALPNDQVTWLSGFWVITQLFRGFGLWQNVVGEFMVLAAVGWSLGRLRLASGGLWYSIGLHAGWVFGMKYFSGLVFSTRLLREDAYSPWLVRNTCRAIVSPVVGIVPLIIIFLTGALAVWLVSRLQSRAVSVGKTDEKPVATSAH
ncbi:MAG: lysostaphin resistance A-like protein [Verrucomicrobium sp.]